MGGERCKQMPLCCLCQQGLALGAAMQAGTGELAEARERALSCRDLSELAEAKEAPRRRLLLSQGGRRSRSKSICCSSERLCSQVIRSRCQQGLQGLKPEAQCLKGSRANAACWAICHFIIYIPVAPQTFERLLSSLAPSEFYKRQDHYPVSREGN